MHKKTVFIAAAAMAASAAQAQQTELVLHIQAAQTTLAPGDSGEYHIWAELLNPSDTVLAVVSNISFDLTFGGTPLLIDNNEFDSTFDSAFFGPAVDGVAAGDSIIGAMGTNTLPPLNNPTGPDSSNPLSIYGFNIDTSAVASGTFTPVLSLNGQIDGAYTGSPFPDVFFYQLADGSPGSVPFSIVADTIVVVPAPTSAAIFGGALLIIPRRRRSMCH